MLSLTSPRHTSTLPTPEIAAHRDLVRFPPEAAPLKGERALNLDVRLRRGEQIVHAGIGREAPVAAERIVDHAAQALAP